MFYHLTVGCDCVAFSRQRDALGTQTRKTKMLKDLYFLVANVLRPLKSSIFLSVTNSF